MVVQPVAIGQTNATIRAAESRKCSQRSALARSTASCAKVDPRLPRPSVWDATDQACLGVGACIGGQICLSDGSGWTACDCGSIAASDGPTALACGAEQKVSTHASGKRKGNGMVYTPTPSSRVGVAASPEAR
jgi:hypothetical protein